MLRRLLSLMLVLALVAPVPLYASRGGGGQVWDTNNNLVASIVGTDLDLTATGLTIGGWVKVTSAAAYNVIVNMSCTGASGNSYLFDFRGATTQKNGLFSSNLNGGSSISSSGTIVDTSYHHVAITFTQVSGGNTTYTFYKDGSANGTGSVAFSAVCTPTYNNLRFGWNQTGGTGADMNIAYWFICKEAVSGANIAIAKLSATPHSVCSTPFTSWTMAGGAGGLVNAVTPGTLDLSVTGTVTDSSGDNPTLGGPRTLLKLKN